MDYPASPNLSHVFPGNVYSFNVRLTVTSSFGCRDSITRTVNLIPSPTAAFEILPGTPSCATQVVQFNDLSQTNGGGAIVAWLWNFDDPASGINNSSTSPSPSHTFILDGTYLVNLQVTNSNGCISSITIPVVVNRLPVADFIADSACANGPTHFTDASNPNATTITSYNWTFGDGGTSTLQSPVHTYATYGIYNATLTIVNSNGCTHSVTKQVVVHPNPVPAFTFSAASCIGNPVSFTDLSFIPSGFSGYIETWIWNFGDGSAPMVINYPNSPNVNYTFLGTANSHVVRLTVITTNHCTDSIEKTVNSIPSPIANYSYSSTRCLGQTVEFYDLTQTNGGGSIQTWDWNFGDPLSGANNTSTLQNPTHMFTAAGKFAVTLLVTSTNGCTHTFQDTIRIDSLPVANFTYSSACEGNPTNFTDTSIPNASTIISYSWDFGDGGTSNLQNPVYVYASYGNYVVKLTVVNSNGCIHTTTQPVIVNPRPIPQFSFSSTSCVGNPVDFFNQSYVPSGFSSYIQTWVWDFDDGTPPQTINFPGNPNVTHTFAGTATIHIVKLVVTTTTGCTDSISKTVTSVPSPRADFAFGIVNCENQPTQFTDLSQTNGGGSIQSWNWNFGDPASGANNTATVQNPVHQFTTFGSFTVTLTVTNGNSCYEIKDTVMVINQKPVADFTADTVCQGSATTFNSSSTVPNATSIVSYSWDFGDGGTSSAQNPLHTYSTFGWYNVTLTVVNSNGCTHSVTKFIAVNPEPVADFTFSSVTCVGNPVNYFDQSFVPTGFSSYIDQWTWDFGDGTTPVVVDFPNSPNVTHTFAGTATSHLVRLTVRTTKGCISFIEKTVTSAPSPVANFSYSDTRCESQDLQFTDLSQTNGGSSIQTWAWNFGDPASGANNTSTIQDPIHQFSAAGSFTVSLTVTNGNGCFKLKDTLIIVNQKPVADFIADTVCEGGNTTFNSGSSVPNAASIVSYNWAFSDGGTSTLQNPQHTFPAFGYYNVTLTIVNSNGCFHSATKQVAVNPKPVPDFMFSAAACSGDSVHYTDMSSVPPGFSSYIDQWIWDFGDGTPPVTIDFPASPNINHLFAGSATSHLVKLTVRTTKGCTAFIEKTVATNLSPIANFSYPAQACENQPMQFTDLSQTNGGSAIQSWLWDFGDPASGANNTSTIQNPIHLFSSFGNFTVSLTVTNSSGCTRMKDSLLTISQKPLANFAADTACLESLTTFTNLSTTPGGTTLVTYLWDFGDGQTATVADPTHLYLTTGIFNVKLTITNSKGCEKDTTKQVLVLGKPIASFIYQSPNCAGDSIQFTDNSSTPHGSIEDWTWDFGDGTIVGPILFPNNQNIKHLYTTGGSYNVKLTIHTSDGCMAEKINEVLVGYHPLANFTFGTTPCALMPLQFTDLSQQNGGPPITGWLWDFGDPASGANNTSNLQNPVHAFTFGGVFTVRLMITNADGCTDTVPDGIQVTVNVAPMAAFTADTSCLASPTQFYDASSPTGTIVAWAWNFGDPASGTNNTSTDQDPTHIYNTQGTYTVTLRATNVNQCVHDTSMLIVVNPKPIAMFQYAAVCVNSETQFTDLSTAPGSSIKSWSWNFGDGSPEASMQNPVHMYITSGTYMVRLLVTNLSNCVDSVIIPVIARPNPVAAFASTGFYCPAGRVDFQDISTAPASAITERFWIFEPGYTSTLSNPSYIFPVTNTNYLVTLVVTDTYGCQDTVVDTVFVKPGFSFTFTNDTVCEGYPTHFTPVNQANGDQLYSITWNFGDPASGPNNTSTLANPSHIFTAPGSYIVKMKAYNSDNCVDSVYRQVTVYKAPEPLFSWNSVPCDSSVTFTDLTQVTGSGPIGTWTWVWGDGQSTVINAPGPGSTSHLYTNDGFYTVKLIIANSSGCIDSLTQTVQRVPCIAAGFTYADTLCARNRIAFADTSLPVSLIDRWEWFWGDGKDTTYTVHNSPIMHTYADSGIYQVKLRIWALVDGTNIHDSVVSMIRIRPTPITYFSNPAVCLNQFTLFRDTSKTFGAAITDWNWTFSANPADTSDLKNPSHKYDTAGIYDVRLITTNRYGCKDSLTKVTRIYGLPEAHYDNTPACAGDATIFTDNSTVADTTLGFWRWSFGDPTTIRDTSQLRDPSYLYPTTGDYSVRMIVQDHFGCLDTIDSTVRVNVTPVGAFTVQNNYNDKPGQVKMDNQSTGADSYQWDFSNGKTSDEENPVAVFSEDGTYTIRLIAVNQFDCADTTYYKYELLFKGLYVPNAFSPTGTNLGVRLFQPVGINLKQYHVSVFDIWGHLMWESTKLDDTGSPTEGWDGTYEGKLMPQANYMWKIDALFVDDSPWEGSDIGVSGSGKTMGTVTLIR